MSLALSKHTDSASVEAAPLAHGLAVPRNPGLDLARAAAITMVFVSHTVVDLVPPIVVTALQWGGKAGVELFFSLSGFLIGSILIRMAQTELSPRTIAGFLFRRWMRTLPAYYAALGFVCWFFSAFNIHHWLLLQNFFLTEPRLLVVSWSLVLEEYFYFFFPLAMLLLAGIVGRGHRLVAVVATLLIVVCAAGSLAAAHGLMTVHPDVMHENPFIRMDCAAYGVLAATLLHSSPRVVRWVALHARLVLGLTGAFVSGWMMLYVGVSHLPVALLRWGFGTWGHAYFALQTAVLDLAFAVLVLALYVAPPRLPRWLGAAVFRISLWSYSIYLMHVIVMTLVRYYAPSIGSGFVGVMSITVTTLVVSAASYHLIERPFLKLRDLAVPGGALRLRRI